MTKKPKLYRTHYDAAGNPWTLFNRGAYWGPFSAWDRARPSFFCALAVTQIDAGAWWEKFQQPPPGFPLSVLGHPSIQIDAHGLRFHRHALDVIVCGIKLDILVLRLRLLAAECECFRTLQGGAR